MTCTEEGVRAKSGDDYEKTYREAEIRVRPTASQWKEVRKLLVTVRSRDGIKGRILSARLCTALVA